MSQHILQQNCVIPRTTTATAMTRVNKRKLRFHPSAYQQSKLLDNIKKNCQNATSKERIAIRCRLSRSNVEKNDQYKDLLLQKSNYTHTNSKNTEENLIITSRNEIPKTTSSSSSIVVDISYSELRRNVEHLKSEIIICTTSQHSSFDKNKEVASNSNTDSIENDHGNLKNNDSSSSLDDNSNHFIKMKKPLNERDGINHQKRGLIAFNTNGIALCQTQLALLFAKFIVVHADWSDTKRMEAIIRDIRPDVIVLLRGSFPILANKSSDINNKSQSTTNKSQSTANIDNSTNNKSQSTTNSERIDSNEYDDEKSYNSSNEREDQAIKEFLNRVCSSTKELNSSTTSSHGTEKHNNTTTSIKETHLNKDFEPPEVLFVDDILSKLLHNSTNITTATEDDDGYDTACSNLQSISIDDRSVGNVTENETPELEARHNSDNKKISNCEAILSDENVTSVSLSKREEKEAHISHVYYTSGSTGSTPKGCVLPLSAVESYCIEKNKVHGINAESNVLLASASTFDPCFGDTIATFLAGGCLVVPEINNAVSFMDASINFENDILKDCKVTHAQCTPSFWQTVVSSSNGSNSSVSSSNNVTSSNTTSTSAVMSDNNPSNIVVEVNECEKLGYIGLEVLALGGESLDRFWPIKGQYKKLLNTYGVTECFCYQTYKEIESKEDARKVGKPYAGNTVFLLQQHFKSLKQDAKSVEKVSQQCSGGNLQEDIITKSTSINEENPSSSAGSNSSTMTNADGEVAISGRQLGDYLSRSYNSTSDENNSSSKSEESYLSNFCYLQNPITSKVVGKKSVQDDDALSWVYCYKTGDIGVFEPATKSLVDRVSFSIPKENNDKKYENTSTTCTINVDLSTENNDNENENTSTTCTKNHFPTGDLVIKGRRDFQVKINGVRIELEEIESKIFGESDLIKKLFRSVTCIYLNNTLIACCNLRDQFKEDDGAVESCNSITDNNIKSEVEGINNNYLLANVYRKSKRVQRMMNSILQAERMSGSTLKFWPKEFLIFSKIPMTQNEKVDRRKLADIYSSSKNTSSIVGTQNNVVSTDNTSNLDVKVGQISSTDPLQIISKVNNYTENSNLEGSDDDSESLLTVEEEFMASVWCEELGITTRLNKDDSFFELGGDSLSALRVVRVLISKLCPRDTTEEQLKIVDNFGRIFKSEFGVKNLIEKSTLEEYTKWIFDKERHGPHKVPSTVATSNVTTTTTTTTTTSTNSNSNTDSKCETTASTIIEEEDQSIIMSETVQSTKSYKNIKLETTVKKSQSTSQHKTIKMSGKNKMNKLSEHLFCAIQSNLPASFIEEILINVKKANPLPPYHDLESTTNKSEHPTVTNKKDNTSQQNNYRVTTPLHIASLHGFTDIVKLLVKTHPTLVGMSDAHGVLPIHFSANLEIFKVLLKSNPRYLCARDQNLQSVLHYFARSSNVEIINFILFELGGGILSNPTTSEGKDDVVDNTESTSISKTADKTVVELVDKSLKDSNNIKAIMTDHNDPTIILDSNGASIKWPSGGKTRYYNSSVDWRDRWHRTPLSWAIQNMHIEACKSLLKARADVNAKIPEKKHKKGSHLINESPLELAKRIGFLEKNNSEFQKLLNSHLPSSCSDE